MRSYPLVSVLVPGLVLLALGGAAGCSSGPACAVDTDCPLGNRCGADGTCQLVGMARDAGSSTDTGSRDGATSDARTDAGRSDGGPADAGEDAPAACPATEGVYPLSTVGVGCTGLTATTMTLTAAPSMFCTFGVLFDAAEAGVLTASGAARANELQGTLNIGGSPTVCVATFSETDSTVDVACDSGCTFQVTRPVP